MNKAVLFFVWAAFLMGCCSVFCVKYVDQGLYECKTLKTIIITNNKKVIRQCLDKGISPDIFLHPVLKHAVNLDIIHLLIDYGVDLDCQDNQGNGPLLTLEKNTQLSLPDKNKIRVLLLAVSLNRVKKMDKSKL